jgi:hypothetical protein
VDIAIRREKGKTGQTPQGAVGGDTVNVAAFPVERVGVRGRAPQVRSTVAVTAQCNRKNDQQPAHEGSRGYLSPQYRNQDGRIDDRGQEGRR